MRSHASISPKFWIGATGKALRGDPVTQVVALYLVSCPHARAIGIYYLPRYLIAHETGLSPEEVDHALASLVSHEFASYDDASEHVWIPMMARFQIGERLSPADRRVKWVLAELEAGCGPFRAAFLAAYGDSFSLPQDGKACQKVSKPDAPSMPLRSGFDAPSMPLPSPFEASEPISSGLGLGLGLSLGGLEAPSDNGVRDSHAPRSPETDPPSPVTDPDPIVALAAAWDAGRARRKLPPERQGRRHENAMASLLHGAEGNLEIALRGIDAYLDATDDHARGAAWSILLLPYRVPSLILRAREAAEAEGKARERAVQAERRAALEAAEPPPDPAKARAIIAEIKRSLATGPP